MAKRKAKKLLDFSINEKFANAKLKKIDALMNQLRVQVGKKGDGASGTSTTLIGAVEELNNALYDTQKVTDMYNNFNNVTLKRFKNIINNIDRDFNNIDRYTD